jgi:hypothetical protein
MEFSNFMLEIFYSILANFFRSHRHVSILNHQEIRFRVLYALYQIYYGGKRYDVQQTEHVIKQAGLAEVDKNDVYGDLVYLQRKKLIDTMQPLGMTFPMTMIINEKGIDAVESIMEQSISTLRQADDSETKKNLDTILEEVSPSGRLTKLFEYMKKRPDLFVAVIEKAIMSVLSSIKPN